jgi:hypothetical protein
MVVSVSEGESEEGIGLSVVEPGSVGVGLLGLRRVFKLGDPPKSPLKRGTSTEFSPLFKAGVLVRSWGGSESDGEV